MTEKNDQEDEDDGMSITRRQSLKGLAIGGAAATVGTTGITGSVSAQSVEIPQEAISIYDFARRGYTQYVGVMLDINPLVDRESILGETYATNGAEAHLQVYRAALPFVDARKRVVTESSTHIGSDVGEYEHEGVIEAIKSLNEGVSKTQAKEDARAKSDNLFATQQNSFWSWQANFAAQLKTLQDVFLYDYGSDLNVSDVFAIELSDGTRKDINSFGFVTKDPSLYNGDNPPDSVVEVKASPVNEPDTFYRVTHYGTSSFSDSSETTAKLIVKEPTVSNYSEQIEEDYDFIGGDIVLFNSDQFKNQVSSKLEQYRDNAHAAINQVVDDIYNNFSQGELDVTDVLSSEDILQRSAASYAQTSANIYGAAVASQLGYETSVEGNFKVEYKPFQKVEGGLTTELDKTGDLSGISTITSDTKTNRVFFLGDNTELIEFDAKNKSVLNTYSLSVDPLYIKFNGANNTIVGYDPNSSTILTLNLDDRSENKKTDLSNLVSNSIHTFETVNDKIYISKASTDVVDVYDMTCTKTGSLSYISAGGTIDYISANTNGYIVVAADGDGDIQMLDVNNQSVVYTISPSDARDLHLNSENELFYLNYGTTPTSLIKYDSGGNQLDSYDMPSDVGSSRIILYDVDIDKYLVRLNDGSHQYVDFADGSNTNVTGLKSHYDQQFNTVAGKLVTIMPDTDSNPGLFITDKLALTADSTTTDGYALDSSGNPIYKSKRTLTGSLYTAVDSDNSSVMDGDINTGDVYISPNDITNYSEESRELSDWIAMIVTQEGDKVFDSPKDIQFKGRIKVTKITDRNGNERSSINTQDQEEFNTTNAATLQEQLEDTKTAQQELQDQLDDADDKYGGSTGGGGFFENTGLELLVGGGILYLIAKELGMVGEDN